MKVEPGIYLIPEQFNGRVTIFLGHPKGAPMEHEGEYRIFRINEKGCCISQFEAQYDEWTKDQFYLVDQQGKRKAIPEITGFKTYEEDTTGIKRIFQGSTGDLGPEKPNIHYISFIVCTAPEYKNWVNTDIDKTCLNNFDQ